MTKKCFALFIFRLVASTHDTSVDIDISFLTLRIGTKFGIVTHSLRLETKLDSDFWIQSMSQWTQNAVLRVQEAIFRM